MSSVQAEDIHEALLALYIPAALAECRLTQCLPDVSQLSDTVEKAQLLRGKLLDAIEMLLPASHSAPAATASRAYDCLRLRYVSGLRVDDVAKQLAVSPRQVYRDLSWAEEQLVRLIGSACTVTEAPDLDKGRAQALDEEIRHLTHKPEAVNLMALLGEVVATVGPLAERQGVALSVRGSETEMSVAATPAVLREVLTMVLSAVIQSPHEHDLAITVERTGRQVTVTIPLGAVERPDRHGLVAAATHVMGQQRLEHRLLTDPVGRQSLALEIPVDKRRRALVVEDNPGATALYERYLSTSEWDPVCVPHPRLSAEWAASRDIDAVILDIMMSEADGWTVLRALQTDPRTREIPVVICSVLKDIELARSLGAVAYLTKPVSRLDLLKALRQTTRRNRPGLSETGMTG